MAGFARLLPVLLAALLLAAAPELTQLARLETAVDMFFSFCASVDVKQLQRYAVVMVMVMMIIVVWW